jgi:uncharacterized protein YcbK (DUF882 family)
MRTRREFLGTGAAMLVAGIASPARASIGQSDVRSLAFDNLHTGEKLNLEYWVRGQYVPDALASINHLLRDYRNGEVHPIHPQLLDLLNVLHRQLDSSKPFEVISGYRSPATNAILHERSSGVAAHSLHMEGKAIDIRLTDRRLDDLHNTALALRAGGVGYYPALDFVHVDVGRVRRWGAASASS